MASAYLEAAARGIEPDEPLAVSEWADRHRRLPRKSSAEPGPWRTSRTPYLREIMDAMSTDSDVEEVVFIKPAQIGGTEAILNVLGYVVDHAPGPAMVVQPTDGLAKRFSRQRIEPMFDEEPLASKIGTPEVAGKRRRAGRDTGDTILEKDFANGHLIITGAQSAVNLRSMPVQYLFLDEIDGYPLDVDEEGSPIALAEQRQTTFARRKRMKISTPTIAGKSAITEAYEATDQRRFYVRCPDCGEAQPLEFERLVWTKYKLPPERAVYECRACYYKIQEHEKTALLAGGEWVAEHPERIGRVRGYHLNALYAPVGWISWGEIARKFTRAHKVVEKFRAFVNTILAQPWKGKGEAPPWEAIQRRRLEYPIGTVPAGVCFLTAGVDVQKDRLVYEVVGWGRDKRSWSIDYGELIGDTADLVNGPWAHLDQLVERSFPRVVEGEHAGELPILMLAIDSGFNTQTVYSWTRKYPLARVIAVKGRDYGGALVGSPSAVEATINGRKVKRGARVFPVCGSIAKSELYGWLGLEAPVEKGQPTPPGFCAFPQYGEEFFKQLTAEQLVPHKSRRGYVRLEWELIPGRQNHVLDARVYARAAAFQVGLDRFTPSDWTKRETFLERLAKTAREQTPPAGMTTAPPEPPPTPPATPTTPAPDRKRGAWITPRPDWLRRRRR